jgi:hypothetical protein
MASSRSVIWRPFAHLHNTLISKKKLSRVSFVKRTWLFCHDYDGFTQWSGRICSRALGALALIEENLMRTLQVTIPAVLFAAALGGSAFAATSNMSSNMASPAPATAPAATTSTPANSTATTPANTTATTPAKPKHHKAGASEESKETPAEEAAEKAKASAAEEAKETPAQEAAEKKHVRHHRHKAASTSSMPANNAATTPPK